MKKNLSLIRQLEYKKLSKIFLSGKVLDLGGSKISGYHEIIKGNYKIEVVNIDESCKPDLKFDIEKEFPITSGIYNHILCLNVLEHIFNFQNVINESFRILKEGGTFVGATPFLFNIHASPNDYFRYTKSAIEKIFKQAGFEEIEIKEMGTGVFSVVYQLKFGLYKFGLVRRIAIKLSLFLDNIFRKIKPNSYINEKYMPLGYFFIAKK